MSGSESSAPANAVAPPEAASLLSFSVHSLPSPEVAAELLAHCEGRLARYKLPRSLDFVDVMPRDPNGKLYKRKLRDPYWAGRDRAI